MTEFLDENFLLGNDAARRLYFDYAVNQPIYDYHSHLSPAAIAGNRQFDNLTDIWLDGDHYKWRAMRTAGVEEQLITGDADAYEKFCAFAAIVPQCIGNPIYHWTHMELRKPLGVSSQLNASTAESVWQYGNRCLAEADCSARGILGQFNVQMVGTTDDPVDTLEHHAAIGADASFDISVLPTWRPDLLFKPERQEFSAWIDALGEATDSKIDNYADLLEALTTRLDYFAAHGCVSADHGFDRMTFTNDGPAPEMIFTERLSGKLPGRDQVAAFNSAISVWLGQQYADRNWVMQLHIGAQRDNNSRMLDVLGPNTGFDSIGDQPYAEPLQAFLNTLDKQSSLPKSILYGLNPRDNEMLATMAGNFQGGGVAGKIQFGSAWWFNDQKDGIRRQLTSVAQMSLLSRFVGMLTDSRSFLSFSRHEYFRRILCDLIGAWVENGEAPADFELLGGMVQDICSSNAVDYFGLATAGSAD